MVSIEIAALLEDFYLDNVEKWIREHPGEYILIEGTREGEQRFFKNEAGLESAVAEYKGMLGPTVITHQIPSEITPDLAGEIHLYRLIKGRKSR